MAKQQCVSFNIGKLQVTANKVNLHFNEHRKLCHKDGQLSFEYGTIVNTCEILLIGSSIKLEKDINKHQFMVFTYIGKKKISERELSYNDIVDLFNKENKSALLKSVIKKLPETGTKLKSAIAPPKSKKDAPKKKSLKGYPYKKGILLKPGKKKGWVINPETDKAIKIGGKTHENLCATGKYTC